MLSSMPMCFNLFGPLVNDRTLAVRLLDSLVPEGVAEITSVALEWAPKPAGEYLGDKTAFDAYFEYRSVDGRDCALGVETKLTEPFSPKVYDSEAYRRWMRVPNAPWRPDADAKVHAKVHNQLWRLHLLAVAMRHHPHSRYAVTRLMIVRHPDDPDCGRIVSRYRQLLRDGDDSLLDMPLDRLIDSWTTSVQEGPDSDWLRAFRVRYLELERSAPYA